MNEKTRKKYLVWGLILLILFFSGLKLSSVAYVAKKLYECHSVSMNLLSVSFMASS